MAGRSLVCPTVLFLNGTLHGRKLTLVSLGLITATRNGISSKVLEDIAS